MLTARVMVSKRLGECIDEIEEISSRLDQELLTSTSVSTRFRLGTVDISQSASSRSRSMVRFLTSERVFGLTIKRNGT